MLFKFSCIKINRYEERFSWESIKNSKMKFSLTISNWEESLQNWEIHFKKSQISWRKKLQWETFLIAFTLCLTLFLFCHQIHYFHVVLIKMSIKNNLLGQPQCWIWRLALSSVSSFNLYIPPNSKGIDEP